MELKETHCEDWTVKPIHAIATIIGGGTPSTANPAYWNGSIPWFTPTEIQDTCKYVSKSKRTITEKALENSGAKLLPVGTILLTTRASIGLRAILKVPAATNQGFQSLVVNGDIDNQFIYYLLGLRQPELIKNASGSTFLEISPKKLGEISLCIPCSLAEQHAIAAVLSDVDALLSSLEALIAKKRDIKTAAMQELLTGRRRLPGFTNAWCTLPFEQCALNIREFVSSKNAAGLCIELENIGPNSGNLVGKLASLNTASSSSLKLKFQANDILFGRLRAYLRKFYYAEFSGACSPEIWVLRAVEKNIIPPYLYQIVQTESFITAASVAYGTHMPRTDWNVVKNFLVYIPTSLKEQTAIAAVLSDMDAEIAALEARRAKVQALKQGMMQELLTGKTRLAPTGDQHG
ncbi:restriction endonuclease subunit S [Desulfovibrio sp. ZJ369]|uniref:restriction endonuclease subunit S n=1 Tax=Desulfovibrio sp. ZJ369 TaxID=2709793 RepID=UPI0013EC2DAF|nr:restriction endonuclease subunit S [Desulfovibrio sp. ZJ369]